ncbi:MAG TPA: hypothetical protein VGR26_05000 [Acidimicrobiales bacterium]|nr:hypothetical protein [Acidimicrobiales bacterium]
MDSRSFASLAGLASVMEEHVGRITGPGLVSSTEEFHRRLTGPVGEARSVVGERLATSGLVSSTEEFHRRLAGPVGELGSVVGERITIGGLATSGLVSSTEEFYRLAGSRSEIEAITPRVDPLADFRSVLDERFTVDRLADVRSVFDHLTGLDHHRLAGLASVMEEHVGRITGVDRGAGQRSDASALRPAIEPADVPAATLLLLLLLALAVTRAGLADTVLENVLAFGRLGVGGLEWLSDQLPDPTAIFWAQYLKAILLAGKNDSGKE